MPIPKASKNRLKGIDAVPASEFGPGGRGSGVGKTQARRERRVVKGSKTRIAADVRRRVRKSPPVIPLSLKEIQTKDAEDEVFKKPGGRKKKHTKDAKHENWREMARKDNSRRKNERRAKVRKYEAEVMAAERENGGQRTSKLDVYTEDHLTSDGVLSLEDWDDAELARGYRRMRNGKFGKPPVFIPLAVQQEAFKRIVRKHKDVIHESFVEATKQLVKLARNSESEKVRLEAVREIFNRTVGRVPERMQLEVDAPWQDWLVDSIAEPGDTESVVTPFEIYEGEVIEEDEEPVETRASGKPVGTSAGIRRRPPQQGPPMMEVEATDF
jgi:hypothetical protein